MKIKEHIQAVETQIDKRTLEETAPHVSDAFPFRSACTDLMDSPGREFPWHWHNEVEILLIVSGRLRFLTTALSPELETGDILFLPGGMLHSTQACGTSPALHKEFIFSSLLIAGAPGNEIDRKYVSPVLRAVNGPVLLKAGSPQNLAAAALLDKAYACYIRGEDGYELSIRHLMDEVWMILRKEIALICPKARRDHAGEERIKSILLFLEKNYGSNLSLKDIASHANISERECGRCFKAQLGLTPLEYLLNLRLNKACALLENTSLSIGEIASACGFASASYFSKQFRGRFRTTPRAFRKE